MLKILAVLFFIMPEREAPIAPGRVRWHSWEYRLTNQLLANMTSHIIKDAFYKLRMADRVVMEYRKSLTYELGVLTSSILDRFAQMAEIYRYYANTNDMTNHTYSLSDMLNGYSAMQGTYDQLKAEEDIFFLVQKEQSDRDKAQNELALEYSKKTGMSLNALKKLIGKGVDLNEYSKLSSKSKRRAMKDEDAKWTQMMKLNEQEAEYKKNLRYLTWAEKWKGFNPETEGVHIPDRLAKMGLANDSDFLLKDIKDV